MKVVWLDLGHKPDFAKLQTIGATGVAFDIRDAISRSYLQSLKKDSLLDPYVYSTPHWPETKDLSGAEFAVWTHALLERIAPRTGNTMPCVCLDIEHHDHLFVRTCLQRWRELRPTRVTDWTLESFQFGWEDEAGFHEGWAAELVDDVERYDVLVAPQFYKGDMAPFAADRAILNAVKGGMSADRLIGCYDARALADGWRGYAFTQGRLP